MQAQNSTQREKQRNILLDNGYLPLPLADKGVYIKGWSRQEITQDWLKQYARSGKFANTGLRCDRLIAFDIDVTQEDLADQCEEYVEKRAELTDFCRIGQWPKRLLLYRLIEVKGAQPRSGRTGKYGGQMCELLTSHGRQFAAFGTHPKTQQPYEWENLSPLTTPLDDLPGMTFEQAQDILEGLDKLLSDSGLPKERRAHTRAGSSINEYDLLPDTIVEYEGVQMPWSDVVPRLTTSGGFGNLFRPEYDDFGDSNGVHFYLAEGSGEPCAHDFVNDCTHWQSVWTPQFAQLLPPPPTPKANTFVPDDMGDMAENCVILRDKTVRRLTNPTRVYPLEGFVRSMQHLQVPDPNPPRSNPNRMIPYTKAWEKDPKTLRADYAEFRPDKPDARIIQNGVEKAMNTYLAVEHPQSGGSIGVFVEFLEHLLPNATYREIFLDWLAHKIQYPHHRMHGFVMVADRFFGSGRGTLVQIMERLFGHNYVRKVELHDLVGSGGGQSSFNAYLAESLIVTIDEALEPREEISKWVTRSVAYERLKTVCDPVASQMHIKRKYGHNTTETVYASLFIQSNHKDALVIPPGDRRLIVVDNNTEVALVDAKDDLYGRIQAWKDDAANIGCLQRWLLCHTSDYNAFGEPPETAAKNLMVEEGQSDVDFLFELFIDECEGDVVSPAQWRTFAHAARMKHDLDLPPDPARRDSALSMVLAQKARRIDGLPKSGVKVNGRPVRPWIIRNFGVWQGSTDLEKIRAEILRNGDPGSNVVELPTQKG